MQEKLVKATVFYGDPFKKGGFHESFEGTRDDLKNFVESCERYMWNKMNCNGNPYCYVEVEGLGLRLDRNLQICQLPQTVGEFLNPPEGWKYSGRVRDEICGIAHGELEQPRTVGSRLSNRRKKYVLNTLKTLPQNTSIEDLQKFVPHKSEAEFDDEEWLNFCLKTGKMRHFWRV